MKVISFIVALTLLFTASNLHGRGVIGGPVGIQVEGCGEVVQTETCGKLFKFYNHPDYGLFLVGDLEAYDAGTVFFISGQVCINCLLYDCGMPYSALINVTIQDCYDGGGPGLFPIDECLTLIGEDGCGSQLWQNADGGLITPDVVLLYPVGTTLHFRGHSPENFVTFCPEGPTSFPILQVESISACNGDITLDGKVDGEDLGALLSSWGSCVGCLADLDGDGQVNGADLGMLLAAWS